MWSGLLYLTSNCFLPNSRLLGKPYNYIRILLPKHKRCVPDSSLFYSSFLMLINCRFFRKRGRRQANVAHPWNSSDPFIPRVKVNCIKKIWSCLALTGRKLYELLWEFWKYLKFLCLKYMLAIVLLYPSSWWVLPPIYFFIQYSSHALMFKGRGLTPSIQQCEVITNFFFSPATQPLNFSFMF